MVVPIEKKIRSRMEKYSSENSSKERKRFIPADVKIIIKVSGILFLL